MERRNPDRPSFVARMEERGTHVLDNLERRGSNDLKPKVGMLYSPIGFDVQAKRLKEVGIFTQGASDL